MENSRYCLDCKHSNIEIYVSPCRGCYGTFKKPNWTPQEPEKPAEPELKPCPFCGGKNLSIEGFGEFFVICRGCKNETNGPSANTAAAAAAAWNKRAEPDLTQAINANIEQRREIERLRKEWAEASSCAIVNGIKARDAEADNKRLRDNLIQCRAENNATQDYAADLRICMRKARKVLKVDIDSSCSTESIYAVLDKARQILKEGLKTK